MERNTEIPVRYCRYCGEQINPKRVKILPHTKTCVSCSTEKPKSGKVTTIGEKDYTCNDIEIIDDNE